MDLRKFLTLLLPEVPAGGGVYFSAAPTQSGWRNHAHTTIEAMIAHVNRLTFEGVPAYYAMATYREARYWDATKEAWRSRTQANTQALRSFYLDLDVKPGDPLAFESKEEALTELRAFVRKLGLPRPMVIDSGGGIHAYWPLAKAVAVEQWQRVASLFKAICVREKFRADRSLTADSARVLRALGSFNAKRGAVVSLLAAAAAVLSFEDFAARIDAYAGQMQIAADAPRAPSASPSDLWGEGNLGESNDPLNFDRMLFSCAQLQQQVAEGGARAAEPVWRAMLGIVKFCEPQAKPALMVSHQHPGFSVSATKAKLQNWNAGPTTCAHLHALNPSACERCPHHGKLTSPAQLGHEVRGEDAPQPAPQAAAPAQSPATAAPAAPAPLVPTTAIPKPYQWRKGGGVVIAHEDGEGVAQEIEVCAYDVWPIRLLRPGAGVVVERSEWAATIPVAAGARQTVVFEMANSLTADAKQLGKYLIENGVQLAGDQHNLMRHYMSVYLQKLAAEKGRETLYDRLGWHGEDFVLGDIVLHPRSAPTPVDPTVGVRNATKDRLHVAGSLDGWKEAMKFYGRPDHAAHRMMVYAGFASAIFHMNPAGLRASAIVASGESGRGKTTAMNAASSVWGAPDALIVNGNRDGATTNALYNKLGTLHSLPMCLDDITERQADDVRPFLLNLTQGEGKWRLNSDGTSRGRVDTWSNITMISTNVDLVTALSGIKGNADPHLKRMLSVEFGGAPVDRAAKAQADQFAQSIREHYGHAGPVFAGFVAQHYMAVRQGLAKNIAMVDTRLDSVDASGERYWSATVAACYTAAQIAKSLGLIGWDVQADLEWMLELVAGQRGTMVSVAKTPEEHLSMLFTDNVRSTLTLSPKQSSNLDNVINKPFDALKIRVEADTGRAFIEQAFVQKYCVENQINLRGFRSALLQTGVLTRTNCLRRLGADTMYTSGQVRCWEINLSKLSPGSLPAYAAPQDSNVVPLGRRSA